MTRSIMRLWPRRRSFIRSTQTKAAGLYPPPDQAHGEKSGEIDGFIERYAKGWKVERISRTALAVLRCAICEILYMEDIPNAAAINEAVELDKNYDDPDTVAFVNGVLGGFMRGELEAGSRRAGVKPWKLRFLPSPSSTSISRTLLDGSRCSDGLRPG